LYFSGNPQNWLEVRRIKEHIYVIRERLDLIDSRFLTTHTNLFLILGTQRAILFDTGSGIARISPLISDLIEQRELIVINSHNHFDHVAGNREFDLIHIHRLDSLVLEKPLDLSFLRDSYQKAAKFYSDDSYKVNLDNRMILLEGGEEFDLGSIRARIVHTPGHTSGSISLLTDQNEIFTGDTVHYGSIYLPDMEYLDTYLNTLQQLLNMVDSNVELYPAHEEYQVQEEIIEELILGIEFIKGEKSMGNYNEFLDARVWDTDNFKFILPR
jgi:glyoxylase-like metal-dependent hydrolase (beta-lactamase superfamily II)